MNLESFRSNLKERALLHLESEQAVRAQKNQNFLDSLARMDDHQRQWWFGDSMIHSITDLDLIPARTAQHIEIMQTQVPPYGYFYPGEVLVQNSGSTSIKKQFPFRLDDWFRYITPAARGLLSLGIDHTDRILTTDPGSTQAGYRTPEDAASWICGAQIVLDRSVSLTRKLEHIRDFKISVVIANGQKLERMAALDPKKWFSHKLKAVINTGTPLTNPDFVKQAFGVDWIMDFYGSVEMGNTYYTCQHGHRHVHDDFVHIGQREGKTLFSNLSSLPIWNCELGDRITYSYKGRCACGSYLPTVDEFVPKSYLGIKKG